MFKKSYKYMLVVSGSIERYRTRNEARDAMITHLVDGAKELGIKYAEFQAPEKLYSQLLEARGTIEIPHAFNRKFEEVTTDLF